jgi:DNA-binding transcriptional regulator YhcF (GntR family)
LAAMVRFLNSRTAKAWPDRRTIAAMLGVEPETVSNKLRELRLWGYLIVERQRVPEANNRSLSVYTLGNIDHETLRREIQIYVDRINAAKVTAEGDYQRAAKPPPGVTVTVGGDCQAPKVTAHGGRKSPPTVDSNSIDGTHKREGLSPKGSRLPEDWSLPAQWKEYPRSKGLSETQIKNEGEKFRRHWQAKAGKDALKARWDLTWENWVDRSLEYAPPRTIDPTKVRRV